MNENLMAHAANEWADMAHNALQHIKNIRDGITTPEAALANLEECLKHCDEVYANAMGKRAQAAQELSPEGRQAVISFAVRWYNMIGFLPSIGCDREGNEIAAYSHAGAVMHALNVPMYVSDAGTQYGLSGEQRTKALAFLRRIVDGIELANDQA